MLRQRYFPSVRCERHGWLSHHAMQLPQANEILQLPVGEIAETIADMRWLAYVTGAWVNSVRDLKLAGTSAVDLALEDDGMDVMAPPVFTACRAVGRRGAGATGRVCAHAEVRAAHQVLPHLPALHRPATRHRGFRGCERGAAAHLPAAHRARAGVGAFAD